MNTEMCDLSPSRCNKNNIQSGGNLMEKRIGTALIQIENTEDIQQLNEIISKHSHIIIGRQGLPRSNRLSIISLVLEGTTDEIGSLTGQLGRLKGIQIKSVLLKNKHHE
jgi:putative iron-only hydrogenase system regulator